MSKLLAQAAKELHALLEDQKASREVAAGALNVATIDGTSALPLVRSLAGEYRKVVAERDRLKVELNDSRQCTTCKYADRTAASEPCASCNSGSNKWEGIKRCDACKHKETPMSVYPCCNCDEQDKWEPK